MFGAPQHDKAVNYAPSATDVLTVCRIFLLLNGQSRVSA